MPSEQFISDKLHFNEMMMMSALY